MGMNGAGDVVAALSRLAASGPPAEDLEDLAALLEWHVASLRALDLDLAENDPITIFDPRWHA